MNNNKLKVTLFFKQHAINLADIKAPKLTVIENIHKQMIEFSDSTNASPPVFNNLINVISDEKILIIAFNNIKSNSGAGTRSMEEITADGASIKSIKNLSLQLKNNTFDFGVIRQIYVPKPGKGISNWNKENLRKYGRPLGIPHFNAKIVQEAIRIVLSAIYEPLFEKTNSYGFRANYSALDALTKIQYGSQGMDWVLEGDISKAFNTMDHNILIKELSTYIIDKKFLNLIYRCCKSGIFDSLSKTFEFPCMGSPQGAIVSPILWNIYMYKFDRFIQNDIEKLIDILNKKQLIRKADPKDKRTKDLYRYTTTSPTKSNEYKKISKKLSDVKIKILMNSNRTLVSRLPIYKQRMLYPLIDTKRILESKLYKTSSIDLSRLKLRMLYVRYADDFIIMMNSNHLILKYIKNKIHSFLKYELKLNLSIEKTLTTNIKKEAVKFLGYSIKKLNNSKIKHIDYDPTIKKRTTSGLISIGIDYNRVLKKFKEKKYLNQEGKISSIGELTRKENVEILMRFNEIITGFAIYYLPIITAKRYFSQLLYILEYSFYKTLCHKNKTTINKIKTIYGKENVSFKRTNLSNPELSKTHTLINSSNIEDKLGATIKKIRDNLFNKTEQKTIIRNIMLEYRKGFWRTNTSMISACINCGSWDNIEYHHIKKLGNDKTKYKYTFDYNIRALNRKAIPLCEECHQNLHLGRLDTRTVEDLYDKRLARYQSYITINE